MRNYLENKAYKISFDTDVSRFGLHMQNWLYCTADPTWWISKHGL